MKTRLLIGAAIVLAAVPAVIGLWGNASFSQDVPVRVPASGQIVPLAPAPTATPSDSSSPSPSPSTSGVDDNGGDTPRDQRIEPGDDRDVQGGVTAPGTTEPGDDNGGATAPGDDHGGSSHGGDDSGSDDHGGSGHGSDD